MDHKIYLEERNFALAVARDQTKFIDQAVLTLAGGALGVSLTFLENFVASTGVKQPGVLWTAWGMLTLSIVAVLIGMHMSQWSIDKHIENLDANQLGGAPTVFKNPFVGATETLNYGASALLIIGLGCLCWFVYANQPGQ